MSANLLYYLSGGQVHAGDRVRYKGSAGNVAFVSDGESGEFSSGYDDYYGHEAGIMFCDDDGDLTFLPEPNEELEFLRRAGESGELD